MKLINSKLFMRKCKYHDKYFVIYGERMLEYCNNVHAGETKPCSVIGPARLYDEKVKRVPILKIYTRAYKKYVARRLGGAITPEQFKEWIVKTRELSEKAYTENIATDEFSDWMK